MPDRAGVPPLLPSIPSWRTLLGLALVCGVITVLFGELAYLASSRFEEERWAAEAQIEYRGQAWVETADVDVASRSRLEPIADAYEIPYKRFDRRLTAGALPGTQILRYRFEDPNPQTAIDVVSDLTNSYLEAVPLGEEAAVERIETEIEALEAELSSLRIALDEVAGPAGVQPTATERVAEAEVNRVQGVLAEAQTRLLEAELAVIAAEEARPELIAGPFLIDEPVAPRPARRAAFGILAGLLTSSLIAASVLTRDRSG